MPRKRHAAPASAAVASGRAAVLVLLVSCATAGCARLAFVNPDASRGDYRRVAPTVDVAADARSGDATRLIQQARALLQAGDFDKALRPAQAAVRQDAKSPDAHTVLAHVLDRVGRPKEAGVHFHRAAELAPTRGETLNNYGAWLCAERRAADSLAWFEAAATAPGYSTPAMALANAGACAREAGDAARAEAYARQALKADATQLVALGTLARVMADQGRWFEARAFSQRRLAVAEDVDSLQLASQIEQNLGDSDAMRRYVERMRKLESAGGAADSGEVEGR